MRWGSTQFPFNSRHGESWQSGVADWERYRRDFDAFRIGPVIDDFGLAGVEDVAECLAFCEANGAAESGELEGAFDWLWLGVNGKDRAGVFVV